MKNRLFFGMLFCFISVGFICNNLFKFQSFDNNSSRRVIYTQNLRDTYANSLDPNVWTSLLTAIWGKAAGVGDTHWLTLPANGADGQVEAIKKFVIDHSEGTGDDLHLIYSDVVIIGMGGSSRPADVIGRTLGTKDGYARIHVMENLDQEDIGNILGDINIDTTLFISISKSGGTAETMALTQIAYDELMEFAKEQGYTKKEQEEYIAEHFIAITTPLDKAKRDDQGNPPVLHQFLIAKGIPSSNIFEHPDGVGGRYTIFSNIGMLPAALAGHDIEAILTSARDAMNSNKKLELGSFMTVMEAAKRIYMRVVLPEELEAIGPWIEQLVAESQGKLDVNDENRGIIPIFERDGDTSVYTDKTFVLRFRMGNSDENDGFIQQLRDENRGIPVWDFTVANEIEALGLLYALEFATGMSGIEMGINPFDQPGVDAGKIATNRIKYGYEKETKEVDEDGKIVKVVVLGLQQKAEDKIKTEESILGRSLTREEVSAITQEEYYKILDERKSSNYRIEITKGVSLDYGAFMGLQGDEFRQFASTKGVTDIASLDPAQLYALTLLYSRQITDNGKTYGAILPYAVETSERAGAWAAARSALRAVGMQDLFGVGPLYEHSYRQYFMQGYDNGFFTFIVPTDPGSQRIPGDLVPQMTTGMQNALQAIGTQQALSDIGRLSVRIEVEGSIDNSISEIKRFFEDTEIAIEMYGGVE